MKKMLEFTFLAIFFVVGTLNALFFIRSPTLAMFIYLIPVIYFLYTNPKIIKRSVRFLILCAIMQEVFYFFTDLHDGWTTISEYPIIFKGIIVEEILFAFLWPLSIIVIYHNFFNKPKDDNPKIDKSFYYFVIFYVFFLATLEFSGLINSLGYAYLIFGVTTFIFPVVYGIIRKGRMPIKPLLIIGILYFIASILWEMLALTRNWWQFNGTYLFKVDIFGFYIPIEEIVIWAMLGAPTLIYLYEAAKKNAK